jgi:hypothetical protein
MSKHILFNVDTPKLQNLIQQFIQKNSQLGDCKRENLPEIVISYATKHDQKIRRRAAEKGFVFNLTSLNKNCIAGVYWPSRKNGFSADAICALAALFIYSLGESSQLKDPIDLVDPASDPETLGNFSSIVRQTQTAALNDLILEQPADGGYDFQIYPLLNEVEFAWIAEAQKKLYPTDHVPREKYDEWFTANPSGFFVFYLNGKIIGHLTLIPFKHDRWAPYRRGEIWETDLGADDIWGIDETDQMTLLYVESYIVMGEYSRLVTPSIRMSFLNMASEVMPISDTTKIFAMNATSKGTNTIDRLGFKPFIEKGARIPRLDKHELFVLAVSDMQDILKLRSPKGLRTDLMQLKNTEKAVTTSGVSNSTKVLLFKSLKELEGSIIRRESKAIKKLVSSINGELRDAAINTQLKISDGSE